MERELVRSWQEAAALLKLRASEKPSDQAQVILRLVDLNIGGNVHDIYEGVASYRYDENLSDKELAKVIRERFNESRKFVRKFEIDRGHEHLIVYSIDVPHVEGVIVW